jgi:hypothetical protein
MEVFGTFPRRAPRTEYEVVNGGSFTCVALSAVACLPAARVLGRRSPVADLSEGHGRTVPELLIFTLKKRDQGICCAAVANIA